MPKSLNVLTTRTGQVSYFLFRIGRSQVFLWRQILLIRKFEIQTLPFLSMPFAIQEFKFTFIINYFMYPTLINQFSDFISGIFMPLTKIQTPMTNSNGTQGRYMKNGSVQPNVADSVAISIGKTVIRPQRDRARGTTSDLYNR